MSLNFNRLKSIAPFTKGLTNGYIRKCQDELFGDIAMNNPYYNIPQLVNNHIMLFYELWTWYKGNYGAGLKFISDSEVTCEDNIGWKTCMFENAISQEICNKFNITFKLKEAESIDFYIGYTKGETIESSIRSWSDQIGEGYNEETSCAWDVYDDELCFSGEGECFVNVVEDITYSVGDLFKLVIDFEANAVRIYHNDNELDSREIHVKKLWIGFSFGYAKTTIEVLHYEYE